MDFWELVAVGWFVLMIAYAVVMIFLDKLHTRAREVFRNPLKRKR